MTEDIRTFTILEQLGRGSFGEVVKVRQNATNKIYCIKKLKIDKNKDATLNEVHILNQMEHQNIIKYYDSFLEGEGDEVYLDIVMEYANGGTLYDIIKYERLSLAQIWKYFIEICEGLNYMHQRNILHRDLKTLNIFLHEDQIKLGDFGTSKILNSSNSMAQTLVGTPYYLSPQLCGGEDYGKESDMWSLGVCLFEMCTGHRPFEAQNQAALIMKILNVDYNPHSITCSEDLKYLVMNLLVKDGKKRFSTSDILNLDCTKSWMKKLAKRNDEFEVHEAIEVHESNTKVISQSSSPLDVGNITIMKIKKTYSHSALPKPLPKKSPNRQLKSRRIRSRPPQATKIKRSPFFEQQKKQDTVKVHVKQPELREILLNQETMKSQRRKNPTESPTTQYSNLKTTQQSKSNRKSNANEKVNLKAPFKMKNSRLEQGDFTQTHDSRDMYESPISVEIHMNDNPVINFEPSHNHDDVKFKVLSSPEEYKALESGIIKEIGKEYFEKFLHFFIFKPNASEEEISKFIFSKISFSQMEIVDQMRDLVSLRTKEWVKSQLKTSKSNIKKRMPDLNLGEVTKILQKHFYNPVRDFQSVHRDLERYFRVTEHLDLIDLLWDHVFYMEELQRL